MVPCDAGIGKWRELDGEAEGDEAKSLRAGEGDADFEIRDGDPAADEAVELWAVLDRCGVGTFRGVEIVEIVAAYEGGVADVEWGEARVFAAAAVAAIVNGAECEGEGT